eukprot:13017932-Alexandrium_andersonii.AAC.1
MPQDVDHLPTRGRRHDGYVPAATAVPVRREGASARQFLCLPCSDGHSAPVRLGRPTETRLDLGAPIRIPRGHVRQLFVAQLN